MRDTYIHWLLRRYIHALELGSGLSTLVLVPFVTAVSLWARRAWPCVSTQQRVICCSGSSGARAESGAAGGAGDRTTSGLGQATTVAHGATRSTERRRRGGPRHGPRVTRGVWGVVCALRKRPDDSRPGTGRDGIVTCERRWHRTATYEISTKTM